MTRTRHVARSQMVVGVKCNVDNAKPQTTTRVRRTSVSAPRMCVVSAVEIRSTMAVERSFSASAPWQMKYATALPVCVGMFPAPHQIQVSLRLQRHLHRRRQQLHLLLLLRRKLRQPQKGKKGKKMQRPQKDLLLPRPQRDQALPRGLSQPRHQDRQEECLSQPRHRSLSPHLRQRPYRLCQKG